VSYWTAYLKANYPAEYMAALLTSVGASKDKMAVYLAETRRMGIKVLPPDVNESQLRFAAVGTDIRFGLGAVRNIGENVVAGIIEARESKGTYSDVTDFLIKVPIAVCNKRAIESLVKAGAFDSLGHQRRGLALIAEQAIDTVIDIKRNEAIGQDSLFGALGGDTGGPDATLQVDIPPGEWDKATLLGFEREMLGLYVSSHPLDGTERILERNRDCSIAELLGSGRTEGMVKIAGIISNVTKKITKQGNVWAIVTIEDHHGGIEALFFPKTHELYGPLLAADTVVSVAGRISDRDGALSLSAQDMTVLDVSSAQGNGEQPVVLVMREERINRELVADLKRILKAHPGKAPVHLQLQRFGNQKCLLMDLDQFTVEPSTSLYGDIKSLLGASSIAT
jgi:DNA polymerase-3 subunit alpha